MGLGFFFGFDITKHESYSIDSFSPQEGPRVLNFIYQIRL